MRVLNIESSDTEIIVAGIFACYKKDEKIGRKFEKFLKWYNLQVKGDKPISN